MAVATEALSVIAGYDLPTAPVGAVVGQPVAFDFVAPAGHSATDWVGIFPVGSANNAYLYWAYVPASASGTVSVPLPSFAVAGQSYEGRYFLANGYTHAATSPTFVAQSESSAFAVEPTPYVENPDDFIVAWSAPANHATNDWIGIYRPGTSDHSILSFQFVGAPGATSGTVHVALPAPPNGGYRPGEKFEARYFVNGGYARVAASPFAIANRMLYPEFFAGLDFRVTYHAPADRSALDWIGVYAEGAADTDYASRVYVPANGVDGGIVDLTLPSSWTPESTFELRYFANDTFVRAAPVLSFRKRAQVEGPETYALAADITARWQRALDTTNDGISIVCSSGYSVSKFLGSSNQTTGATTLRLPANATGSCEVSYSLSGSIVARSAPFTIQAVYTLDGPPAPVVLGVQASGTWFASQGHSAGDWIGLYRVGTSDAQYLAWAYVGPSSQQRGTTSFTVPSYLPVGSYELRYFVDYGFDLAVTSAPFDVVAP